MSSLVASWAPDDRINSLAYARARRLCRRRRAADRLQIALFGEWAHQTNRANPEVAQSLARELLRLSRKDGAPIQLLNAHRAVGVTAFWLGDGPEARDHLERALACYDPRSGQELLRQFPVSPQVSAGA